MNNYNNNIKKIYNNQNKIYNNKMKNQIYRMNKFNNIKKINNN